MLGHLLEIQFPAFRPTHPLVTVCVLLLDLAITLAKPYLVLVFSIEDTCLSLFSFMTAPFESLLLMVIHDIYSVLTSTYLHFSQVRKPILDSFNVLCPITPMTR